QEVGAVAPLDEGALLVATAVVVAARRHLHQPLVEVAVGFLAVWHPGALPGFVRLPELTPVEELDASLEAASVRRLPAVRRRRGGLLDELLAPAPAAQGLEADLLDGQLAALRVLVHGRPCHQQ